MTPSSTGKRSSPPCLSALLSTLCLFALSFAATTRAADCNLNGTLDTEEVVAGSAADCNDDGTPDECELDPIVFGFGEQSLTLPFEPRDVVIADVNGDGIDDLVTGFRDDTKASTLVVFVTGPDGEFLPGVEYDAGLDLSGLTADDLDGDGDGDVVSANSTVLLVFLNRGDGTFERPVEYAVFSATRIVKTGDLSGDGRPELVTINVGEDAAQVFTNRGDGTFDAPTVVQVGPTPVDVDVADVDADSRLDLVVAESTASELMAFRNRGDGTFDPATTFPTGRRPTALCVGDFDGNGTHDVLTTNSRDVTLLAGDGNGTFEIAKTFEIVTRVVTADDFDADGDIDIAIFDAINGEVRVLAGDGAGEFGTTAVAPNVRRGILDVRAGDFDGDGDFELALSSPNELNLLWNGDGVALDLQRTTVGITIRPHSGTVADFNGDGRLDVATANGNFNKNFSLLFGRSDGFLDQPVETTPPDTPSSAANNGRRDLNFIDSADFDRDGAVDIVLADRLNNELLVFFNDGTGGFERWLYATTDQRPFSVETSDLNSDGAPDLISANQLGNNLSIILNDGGGSFADSFEVAVGREPWELEAADLDGDGDSDLAVATRTSSEIWVLENDGAASFSLLGVNPISGGTRSVAVGDFNRDGAPDIAAAIEGLDEIGVILNSGNGTFGPPQLFPIGVEPYSVRAADIDGDGATDLVTADEDSSSVTILIGEGDGLFRRELRFPVGDGPRYVVHGDFDSDGDVDVVSLDRNSAEITHLTNTSETRRLDIDFLETLCTPDDFDALSIRSSSDRRANKYIVPARPEDPSLLPPLFQNTKRYSLHQEFLARVFPDRFPALTAEQYNTLVGRRRTRDYYVGVVVEVEVDPGSETDPRFAFTVAVDTSSTDEVLSQDEVTAVHTALTQAFDLGALCYFPDNTFARQASSTWTNTQFTICGDTARAYQAYTTGVGFGRVRILDADALEQANSGGEISFQDILVLDHAPRDIEGVFGGVVTTEPQTALSHLLIRTAGRGTPNAFSATALETFAPLEGELVRLEVQSDRLLVRVGEIAEAIEFWESRPTLPIEPRRDEQFGALPTLLEISAFDAAAEPETGLSVSRVGGKATGLARLQRILQDPPWSQYIERGFAIPVRYYVQFLRSNELPSLANATHLVSYEEYIAELLSFEAFRTDSRFRAQALSALRDHMRTESQVDPALVATIAARVAEVMGAEPTTRVRFRSSSNVEDGLLFSGAGLYDSTSGCVADDLDADTAGPSLCDATRENERTIARALKRVWSSLWNFRAFEEREFFGIPQEPTSMGILVNRTFIDEAANGVAFTGNPSNALDRRFVITVQAGEESVVSPDPGVRAERTLLEVIEGRITRIVRVEVSSLLPAGEYVLSDAQLHELGELMWHIDQNYELELGEFSRRDVLLDLEFKFMPDGELAVKQVRPFLLGDLPAAPVFELEIPPNTTACGVFALAGAGRGPRDELQLKSTVRLKSGVIRLETLAEGFTAEIFDEVIVGPGREVAVPVDSGRFTVQRSPGSNRQTTYRFTYAQFFELPGARELLLEIVTPLEFRADGDEPIDARLTIDEDFLTADPGNEAIQGQLDGDPVLRYGSCRYTQLPAGRIDATLADGTTLVLEERFDDDRTIFSTSPAMLESATLSIGGATRSTGDYFRLVYSAFKHNSDVRYWVLLDPPVDLAAVDGTIHAVELFDERVDFDDPNRPLMRRAAYLGENFDVLAEVGVESWARTPLGSGSRFRRADVNADSTVDLSDALQVLNLLFRRGEIPSCLSAADANDDGRINVTDALNILLHLFRGESVTPPAPFAGCGFDPTPDILSCRSHSACD